MPGQSGPAPLVQHRLGALANAQRQSCTGPFTAAGLSTDPEPAPPSCQASIEICEILLGHWNCLHRPGPAGCPAVICHRDRRCWDYLHLMLQHRFGEAGIKYQSLFPFRRRERFAAEALRRSWPRTWPLSERKTDRLPPWKEFVQMAGPSFRKAGRQGSRFPAGTAPRLGGPGTELLLLRGPLSPVSRPPDASAEPGRGEGHLSRHLRLLYPSGPAHVTADGGHRHQPRRNRTDGKQIENTPQ